MNQLYSTSQASEVTGIPAGTIRSWLSRYPEVFKLGPHVVKDENGRNMWTSEGIALLKQRHGGETQTATPGDAFFDLSNDAITEQFLSLAADIRARHILRELPMRTLQRLRELIANSPEVQESLQATIYQITRYQLPGANNAATTEE